MIKTLKLSDIQVTPFVASREWNLSNTPNESLILLDQTGSNGEDLSIWWERIIYGDGTYPYTSSVGSIALDQQNYDDVIYQEGISGSGLFYPDSEPTNADGTYKRLVYSTINNMFYNNYKDPTKLWGLENIDIQRDQAKKFIGGKIRSFMVPRSKFGEKLLEHSIKLTDNSLDNEYEITDDGLSNLYASFDMFSRVQEISDFDNYVSGGYSSVCDFYVSSMPPGPPYALTGSVTSSADILLTWLDSTTSEQGFNVYRATGSVPYASVGQSVADTVTYLDCDLPGEGTYNYYVTAYNYFGESTASNIITVTSAPSWTTNWESLTDNWEDYSGVLWS
jgi:hypothetical protein